MRRGNNGDRAVVCLIFCAFESVRFIMTSQDTSVSITSIQSENWSGCIPIILSLAPTSLSSPSMPSSIHVLVHRHSFLHIGLKQAVMRLYKFAPVSSFSSLIKREEPGDENTTCTGNHQVMNDSKQDAQQEQYPVCWFEDEDTQFALRWHLFVGVLWDMKQQKKKLLPWKIRLHFTQYPSSQILPMDNGGVLETVERYYMNSLKQALFSQYSSNKVAMNMSKQTHEQIWDSITTNNYQLFHQVNTDLQQTSSSDIKLLPVRVLVNSTKPSIQRPCRISGQLLCGVVAVCFLQALVVAHFTFSL